MTAETARAQVERVAHSIHRRGLTHGRTGNLAVRDGSRILVTPTGVSLGDVVGSELSVLGELFGAARSNLSEKRRGRDLGPG